MKLILASQSTIRARLLAQAGLQFEIKPAHIDESPVGPAFQRASRLASAKASHLSYQYPDKWVLGADQVGIIKENQQELLKPEIAEEAFAQLQSMSGKTHIFRTVACLWHSGKQVGEVYEDAEVTFLPLTVEEIKNYIDTQEWKGCCGGYRIEEKGAQLVENIQGSLFAVYGLPLIPILNLFRQQKLIFQ